MRWSAVYLVTGPTMAPVPVSRHMKTPGRAGDLLANMVAISIRSSTVSAGPGKAVNGQ